MKNYKIFLLLMALLVITLLPVGCINSPSYPSLLKFFPMQKQVESNVMLALLQGVLTRDNDGYLRVYNELIIWPYGYTYQMRGNDIWILDENNTSIFKVGDSIKIGGGEVPKEWAEAKIGQVLPENCDGPYWLMGSYVK